MKEQSCQGWNNVTSTVSCARFIRNRFCSCEIYVFMQRQIMTILMRERKYFDIYRRKNVNKDTLAESLMQKNSYFWSITDPLNRCLSKLVKLDMKKEIWKLCKKGDFAKQGDKSCICVNAVCLPSLKRYMIFVCNNANIGNFRATFRSSTKIEDRKLLIFRQIFLVFS